MSKDLERRVEDLEAEILPSVKEPPPSWKIMHNLFWDEWNQDWEGTGIERVEEAIEDIVKRLKACPLTAEYGEMLVNYKSVIVEVLRDEDKRRHDSPRDDSLEYREA